MGKFAQILEAEYSPTKRKFTVHAQDEHGKAYKFSHESYGTKQIHDHSAFHPAPGDGPAHKLVKIMHGKNDVTHEHDPKKAQAHNESAVLDEAGILDELDEKLKVLAPGITASGVTHAGDHVTHTHNSPSRMQDQHKDTEYGQAHRKAAAEKIKARRAETGEHGSKPFKDKAGFAVYKEGAIDEAHVKFHHLSSVPHKEVRIQDDHREAIHKLEDGKSHSSPGGHLITTFNKHGDNGSSHFVTSHREGDVVHMRDAYTKKHVATVSHSDTAEHNPTKHFKYLPN